MDVSSVGILAFNHQVTHLYHQYGLSNIENILQNLPTTFPFHQLCNNYLVCDEIPLRISCVLTPRKGDALSEFCKS